MNLLPIEMREVQDKQRQDKINLIHKYQDKLNFSAISLLFFLVATAWTFFMPIAETGLTLLIIFAAASLVFIQQTIRSYNYREFHKNNYRFMEGAYDVIEKGLKMKD